MAEITTITAGKNTIFKNLKIKHKFHVKCDFFRTNKVPKGDPISFHHAEKF